MAESDAFRQGARVAHVLKIDPAVVVFETDWRRRAVRTAAAHLISEEQNTKPAPAGNN